jgi:tetratricopeptide (TPR) repeat protein
MKNNYRFFTIPFVYAVLYFMMACCTSVFAQNRTIDSLLILSKKDRADTNKITHLTQLSGEYINIGLYDSALNFSNKALEQAAKLLTGNKVPAESIRIKKSIANSYGNIGTVYYYSGDYNKTLEYWTKALDIDEGLKNNKGIAKRLGSIGNVYVNQGEYTQALNYYIKALNISNELKDKEGISVYLANIGVIYLRQGNYSLSIENYFKALKISEELGNNSLSTSLLSNIGIVYNNQKDYYKALEYYFKALKIAQGLQSRDKMAPFENIGDVYWNLHNYDEALNYYFKALGIAEELGNQSQISKYLGNIGSAYKELGKLDKALDYDLKSLKIAEKLEDKMGISSTLGYIGMLYIEQKKYKDAYRCFYRIIAIDDSLGEPDRLKNSYEMLSILYEKANIPLPDSIGGKPLNLEQMRLRSIYYYKRSIAIKDAVFNEASQKQILEKEMNYEFEKKKSELKSENEKKQAVADAKSKDQQIVIWSVSIALLLLLLFTIYTLRSLKTTNLQKQIIEKKNNALEQQRKIIEEKNKSITDSINYAKRIQDALLREEEHVSLHLPEHFILFIPKDIVSGDFYWGTEKNEYWYFAAADCTGHGVPGAIMCMLGISFLNDIIAIDQILNPAEILNRLRDRMIKELRQTGETEGSKDGMDISLGCLNMKTYELQWAGANNSITLIRKGDLERIKADKQPIGYHPESKPFTNHKIELQKGDSIYIYSDGYTDQFGGPAEKKLGYKKLEAMFMIHNHKPMKEQKDIFRKRFAEWKGQTEQTDDVCLFGVRI